MAAHDRITAPDPVAIERGPIVYCLESADVPAGVPLEEVALELRAIPYFAWANRAVDGMRIWIPMAPEADG